MPFPSDNVLNDIVKKLAKPGERFHARALQCQVTMERTAFHAALHRLQDQGYIRFTGEVMQWERVK